MDAFDRLQHEIARWSTQTFGERENGRSCIAHLRKEVEELAAHPDRVNEFVDCLMLLLDAARLEGFTGSALIDATWDKLDVNRHRAWGEADADGVVEHVETEEVTVVDGHMVVPSKPGRYRVVLGEGAWVFNPASTKGRTIRGPCTLDVDLWPDGGIDVVVRDPNEELLTAMQNLADKRY